MNNWYLYADPESSVILESRTHKVLLVGGCFGHSNFGDILQLKDALRFHRNENRFVPIPVFSLEYISDPRYIAHAKQAYGVDALLFLSQQYFDVESEGLCQQVKLVNVSLLHLYGGGFLNEKWGDFVLSVTEHLLTRLRIQNYMVSGQQVDAEFAPRVARHIQDFRPAHVGTRDPDSRRFLHAQGVMADDSFDDAYDELGTLVSRIPRERTLRALIHLNLSGYTENARKERDIISILEKIGASSPAGIVAFNAYNEKGVEVIDTLRSIALLGNEFPFHEYHVVDGSALAFHGFIRNLDILDVQIAVSCSYHVALFMHLLGVPCYLSANYSFYRQKRTALGCTHDLEQFMNEREVPDYSPRIDKRRAWQEKLGRYVKNLACGPDETAILEFHPTTPKIRFQYKSSWI